jgi:hypothetical protein
MVGRAYEDLTGYFPDPADPSGQNHKKSWFRNHLHTYACAPHPSVFSAPVCTSDVEHCAL